jgi:signal transduction histidine kinase/ActR/RegA family two-component response regulator
LNPPAASTPRVLVVDDSLPQLKLICLTLERSGFAVEPARNGAEALLLLETDVFDAIVSDCRMPLLDGYQLCRLVKDDPRLAHVPVVLLTGTQDRLSRFWARTCGAEAFLLKGGSPSEVPETVKAHLKASLRPKKLMDGSLEKTPKTLEAIQHRLAKALERRLLEVTLRNAVASLHVDLPGYTRPAWGFLELLEDLVFPGVLYLLAPSPEGPKGFLLASKGVPEAELERLRARVASHPTARGGILAWQSKEVPGWPVPGEMSLQSYPLQAADPALEGEWGFLSETGEAAGLEAILQVASEEFQRLFSGMVMVAFLADANRRLMRLEQARSEFISTLSHEIRNPLNAAQSALRLLAKSHGPGEDGPELVDIAQRNVARLLRLANGVLDLERVESGQLVVDALPLDMREAAQSVLYEIELRGRERGIRTEMDQGPVPKVLADRDLMAQCLINLLSNALEHSPDGGLIRVGFALVEGQVQVSVTDEGPGVPVQFQERIFHKFQQADGLRKGNGVGLGLAITRALAQAMNGSVRLERAGPGACFVLDLPAVEGK